MSAPYNDVFSKLCQAAEGLVLSKQPAYQGKIFIGEGNADMETPCIRLYAQTTGEEEPQYSGNWWAEFNLEVIWPAADQNDGNNQPNLSDTMVATVMDIFLSKTLPSDLNNVGITDFTCMADRNRTPYFHDSGDQWVNGITMQLLVCASTLYP